MLNAETIYRELHLTTINVSFYLVRDGKYRNICSTNIVTTIKSVIFVNILHIVTTLSF